MMVDWQPIETAPHGKVAIFFLDWADDCKGLNPPIADGPWMDERYFFGRRGLWSSMFKATHWMPFPPPPQEAER